MLPQFCAIATVGFRLRKTRAHKKVCYRKKGVRVFANKTPLFFFFLQVRKISALFGKRSELGELRLMVFMHTAPNGRGREVHPPCRDLPPTDAFCANVNVRAELWARFLSPTLFFKNQKNQRRKVHKMTLSLSYFLVTLSEKNRKML